MQRSDRKASFAKNAVVLYQGKHWYWGNRSGCRRILMSRLNSGTGGLLVPERDIFVSIFPTPEKDGSYNKKFAVRWEEKSIRGAKIRLYALEKFSGRWIGAIEAKYGPYDALARDESLLADSMEYDSEEAVIRELLTKIFDDLDQVGRQGQKGNVLAHAIASALFDGLPEQMVELEAFGERRRA